MNCTDPLTCNYNLSRILEVDVITEPGTFLYVFDSVAGGFLMITFLAVLGLVVFVVTRNNNVDDLDSIIFSSFMTTIIGVLLFLVPLNIEGAKLITWARLIPFIVILLISVFIKKSNLNY